VSPLLPHYADRLRWIVGALERAPDRATAAAAEFGASHEATELRAWVAYTVEDLRRLISNINDDINKEQSK
jgi:predicted dehydrogenase